MKKFIASFKEYLSEDFLSVIKKLFVFLLIYSLGFFLLSFSLNYAMPFVVAFIIALIFRPLKNKVLKLNDKFRNVNLSNGLIASIITFSILILLGGLISGICYKILKEMMGLLEYISNPETLNYTLQSIEKYFDSLLSSAKSIDPNIITKLNEAITEIVKFGTSLITAFMKNFIGFAKAIPTGVIMVLITVIATYFFIKEIDDILDKIKSIFSDKGKELIVKVKVGGQRVFASYIKAYLLIMLVISALSFIIYKIANVEYALAVAIITGILDLLPVIGAGIVYLIIGISLYFNGNTTGIIILIIGYILMFVVRQILEQKLVSSFLGVHPLVIIIGLFLVLTPLGVKGMLYFIGGFLLFKIVNNQDIES